MGYDSNECIVCYCTGGGNNSCNSNPARNICHVCFLNHCPQGLRGRATLQSYIQRVPRIKCDFYDQSRACLYQVNICSNCVSYINPDQHKLLDSEIMDVCAIYSCMCPHCPSQDQELANLFMSIT